MALLIEIISKRDHLTAPINTIYFGGGTPSMLEKEELMLITETLYKNFDISNNLEFTLECNPDDLSPQKLKDLKEVGVNRLSIGVQSFDDDDLKFFNRAHSAADAQRSVLLSQDLGFNNLTIDLIYGSPSLTQQKWEENLKKIEALNVPHLSAYTLTIEPKTALHHQVKTGKTIPLSDEKTIEQFQLLIQRVKELGLTQYEISNFGKEGFYSQHNSNYWKGVEYLGVGPSAHSFINNKRFWNVSNNAKYIKALQSNSLYFEEEIIDEKTAYNEYILTRLRTIWGIDVNYINTSFNTKIKTHFKKEILRYVNSNYLHQLENIFTLTNEGIFIADKISSDLFYTS